MARILSTEVEGARTEDGATTRHGLALVAARFALLGPDAGGGLRDPGGGGDGGDRGPLTGPARAAA